MTDSPRVTFVVPVRDAAGKLGRCLASICGNRYAGAIETVVVDNGSHDDSADVGRAAGATVVVLPELPVSALRNAGAAQATGEVLAFVDADHVIDPSWASAAVELLADHSIAGVGSPYLQPPDVNWVQRAYNRFRSHRPGLHDVEWLGSGNLALRRRDFFEVGGFDATLETCEDVDLCNRLRARGGRIVSDDRLRSIHYGDPSTLRAVFFGELWRGRDNLRATLRGPITAQALPSLLIPIANVFFIAAAALGAAASPWIGPRLALAGLAGFLVLAGLRAARMTLTPDDSALRDLGPNLAVACAYDLARALALVTRTTHRTRREAVAAS